MTHDGFSGRRIQNGVVRKALEDVKRRFGDKLFNALVAMKADLTLQTLTRKLIALGKSGLSRSKPLRP
jgi:hypothetical protein